MLHGAGLATFCMLESAFATQLPSHLSGRVPQQRSTNQRKVANSLCNLTRSSSFVNADVGKDKGGVSEWAKLQPWGSYYRGAAVPLQDWILISFR